MSVAARTAVVGDNRPSLITTDQLAKDFPQVEAFIAELEKATAESPLVIEDDADMETVNALAVKLGSASKRCDVLRDDTGRPHLEAKRVIDGFFKGFMARADKAQAMLAARATAYLRKKAAAERAKREAEEAVAREAAAKAQREAAAAVKAGDAEKAALAQAKADEHESCADQAADAANAKPSELARTQTGAGSSTLEERWSFEITDINTIDLNALRPFLPQTAIEQSLRAFVKSGRRQIAGARIFPDTKARFR
jgi:hypothetical protein